MTARVYPFIAANLDDAAKAVGLSPDSLAKAVRSGDLVPRYYGNKPLFRAVDLDEWIDSLPQERPSK